MTPLPEYQYGKLMPNFWAAPAIVLLSALLAGAGAEKLLPVTAVGPALCLAIPLIHLGLPRRLIPTLSLGNYGLFCSEPMLACNWDEISRLEFHSLFRLRWLGRYLRLHLADGNRDTLFLRDYRPLDGAPPLEEALQQHWQAAHRH